LTWRIEIETSSVKEGGKIRVTSMARQITLGILHNCVLSTISNYHITYLVIDMIYDRWNKAYVSLYESFTSFNCSFFYHVYFPTKISELDFFRLGVYKVLIFKTVH
jgi:hypothetical protein